MNGDYTKLNDKDAETRKVLKGTEKMLDGQETTLRNIVVTVIDTKEILEGAKENLVNQGKKIEEAIATNEDIKVNINRADELAKKKKQVENFGLSLVFIY